MIKDDRTVEDQLSDLGVPVERLNPAKNIEKVKFYNPKNRLGGGMSKTVTVGKSCLCFSHDFKAACEEIKCEGMKRMRLKIGVGDYDGKKVLIMKPEAGGYAFNYSSTSHRGRLGSANLIAWLKSQGLALGRYEIVRAKGGFIGVPRAEGEGKNE